MGAGKKIDSFAGKKIQAVQDYSQGLNGLPKSDVLKYLIDGNCSVVIRPSGTEPKMKVYVSVMEENEEKARYVENEIMKGVEKTMV